MKFEIEYFPKLSFYKGVTGKFGALQLSPSYNLVDKNDEPRKSGPCVFINAAPATGKNEYDWKQQQVVISLSITDMAKIIDGLKNKQDVAIYHDTSKRAGTADAIKSLNIKMFSSKDKQGFMFNFLYKQDKKEVKFTVPISLDEAASIIECLANAISITSGFGINPAEIDRKFTILNDKLDKLLAK